MLQMRLELTSQTMGAMIMASVSAIASSPSAECKFKSPPKLPPRSLQRVQFEIASILMNMTDTWKSNHYHLNQSDQGMIIRSHTMVAIIN